MQHTIFLKKDWQRAELPHRLHFFWRI